MTRQRVGQFVAEKGALRNRVTWIVLEFARLQGQLVRRTVIQSGPFATLAQSCAESWCTGAGPGATTRRRPLQASGLQPAIGQWPEFPIGRPHNRAASPHAPLERRITRRPPNNPALASIDPD